jgi:disulfide bond formation protein DsbB|tara:strand:+ start:708 stop:1190 length:483 start_codon:yes stop_codon:yes gene_type:complete
MLEKNNNIFLIFILLLISIAFVATLIIQYGLGHQPCKLCLYERIPYVLSILLIVVILFIKKYQKAGLLILSVIFLLSFSLAFYHFGIEQGFFEELSVCGTGNNADELSKEQVLELLKQNTLSCKDVTFRILGLSLATINSIFSFILSGMFLRLFIKYENN